MDYFLYFAYSVGDGIYSKPLPETISAKLLMSSGCRREFEARVSSLSIRHGDPSKRVTVPPASLTRRTPAAVSHGFRLNSQNPSYLPAATLARSREAEPARRNP